MQILGETRRKLGSAKRQPQIREDVEAQRADHPQEARKAGHLSLMGWEEQQQQQEEEEQNPVTHVSYMYICMYVNDQIYIRDVLGVERKWAFPKIGHASNKLPAKNNKNKRK